MADRRAESLQSGEISKGSICATRDPIALDEWAKLIALGEVHFPTDLTYEDSSALADKVRSILRKKFLHFIAETIANRLVMDRTSDLKPSSKESTNAAEYLSTAKKVSSGHICSYVE